MADIIKKILVNLSLLGIGISLLSCSKHPNFCEKDGRLPYRVSGVTDPSIVASKYRLNRAGLDVVSIGQEQMISIPMWRLFKDESPMLTANSYSLLNMIVGYLKEYRMISVHINAYAGKGYVEERNKALTLARAKEVSKYLWSQGIDTRLIFTEGLGSVKPIVYSTKMGDRSPNARMEIIFRQLIA